MYICFRLCKKWCCPPCSTMQKETGKISDGNSRKTKLDCNIMMQQLRKMMKFRLFVAQSSRVAAGSETCKIVERIWDGPDIHFCTLATKVRYVGVIWFVFPCTPISTHKIHTTKQSLPCISNSTLKYLQKLDWNLDLSWISYGSACLLVS